jgi:hypothetical protein
VTANKDALPDKVVQIETADLNGDEMALVIKCFKAALKGCKDYPNKRKSRGKRTCFKCDTSYNFIAQCFDNENGQDQDKIGKKKEKFYRTTKDSLHPPSISPPASPTSLTLASWRKRRRYVLMIPLSILLLVMRILMLM